MSSRPEPASESDSDRQPESAAAIERHRHRAADAAEAMADALRANDWPEWSRAFEDFQAHMEAARDAGDAIDAVPDAVDAESDATGYAATVERAEELLENDPFEEPESGAFSGAAERAPDQHPMTEGQNNG